MKKLHFPILLGLGIITLILFTISSRVYPHCEIPCGIYNDDMRLDMMAEEITTIEKSIQQINLISQSGTINYNQLVRWINNKEEHADALCEIVTQYFLKQRIKPQDKSDPKGYDVYVHKLILLHKIMIDSMKCKQTSDLECVQNLKETLDEFKTIYLGLVTHAH